MKGFNRFYLWGVKMKYHMSIYTVAGVFFKASVNALQGVDTSGLATDEIVRAALKRLF